MKKIILVPTDFSKAALNAARYAADMANARDAQLYLLHVYQVPVGYGDVPVSISVSDMEQIAEKNMADFKKQLEYEIHKQPEITTGIRMGEVFSELEALCETLKPYVVVMGRQGATAAERFLFGSHAVRAMKHLKWPLITVPQDAKFAEVKKIALACDFNKVADSIPADDIITLVKDFKAELHVLNTGKEKEDNAEIVHESGKLFDMLAELHPAYHFISHNDIDQGIIEYAEQNHIDLLIILPRRHGLLNRLIHKSHTRQFVLHSGVPVMALHKQN